MQITFDTGEEIVIERNNQYEKYRVKLIEGFSDDMADCLVLCCEETGDEIVLRKFYDSLDAA